jgi:hypothetical protein
MPAQQPPAPPSEIDLRLAVVSTLPEPPGGWTVPLIAAAAGVSETLVRRAASRALEKLRARAEELDLRP